MTEDVDLIVNSDDKRESIIREPEFTWIRQQEKNIFTKSEPICFYVSSFVETREKS